MRIIKRQRIKMQGFNTTLSIYALSFSYHDSDAFKMFEIACFFTSPVTSPLPSPANVQIASMATLDLERGDGDDRDE